MSLEVGLSNAANDEYKKETKDSKGDYASGKSSPISALYSASSIDLPFQFLIKRHEPESHIPEKLRAECKIMRSTGLISGNNKCSTASACGEAYDIISELSRLLPKTR